MATYFGRTIPNSAFRGSPSIRGSIILPEEVIDLVGQDAVFFFGTEDEAIVKALYVRFGIKASISDNLPPVHPHVGDVLVVFETRGLPDLVGRLEYTPTEIIGAGFTFYVLRYVKQ